MNKKKYNDTINVANQLFVDQKFEEAIEVYEQAMELGFLAQDAINLGICYLETKKYGRAEDLFKMVYELEKDPRLCHALGNLYIELGRIKEAISFYEEAIALGATNPYIFFDSAYAYEESKEFDKAIQYYEKVLEIDPKYYWACLNLGSLYEQKNENEKALGYFLRAYELDQNGATIHFNLGVIYSKLQDKEQALQHYLLELEKEDHYQHTYFNLGLLYKDYFHDYEQAKLAYLKGLEENKENYAIWYNLGCLYAVMDDYPNAYECFLYLFYKKREMLSFLESDEELDAFRSSVEYKEIMALYP
ncbi:MAG: tetratricopeptide repeat protein [Bacilli bacterium]|jgi:tetratricopeptide (TPR) repeat protein|nr:tetratricopeptide repeat protein [Bacilli bacterium]MDY0063967.1 tetratricopeptide repeat protein [Bacilli bacterium]